MNNLVVPLALAGLQVDAHEAVAEQVVAWPMTAVQVRCRIFDGKVHKASSSSTVICDQTPVCR
jgi:hypothetical protein